MQQTGDVVGRWTDVEPEQDGVERPQHQGAVEAKAGHG